VRPVVEVREREPLPHHRRVQLVVGVPVRQALRSPMRVWSRVVVCACACVCGRVRSIHELLAGSRGTTAN
jgi:hypothetical protein